MPLCGPVVPRWASVPALCPRAAPSPRYSCSRSVTLDRCKLLRGVVKQNPFIPCHGSSVESGSRLVRFSLAHRVATSAGASADGTALRCAVPEGIRTVATRRAALWAGRYPTHHPQMNETELPCVTCGAALVERPVDASDLSITPPVSSSVAVAEWPSYEAHYYSENSLEQLAGRPSRSAADSSEVGD